MKTKATVELGSLADPEFFERVAEGMNHCIRNATSLLRDARRLGRGERNRSSGVLVAFGHEEIAKYLILLDAVRCSRQDQKIRTGQLKRFSDHLAKGLYIELYDGSAADLAEVRRRADDERAKFYLDGPNDVDWIFRNQIITAREQSLYVDYVVADEGARWHRPDVRFSMICGGGLKYRRNAHQVVLALHAAGFTDPKALSIVAGKWRPLAPDDATHWQVIATANLDTLKQLETAGILRTTGAQVIRTILNKWTFPLYGLDLSERDVPLDELRERRANWTPDW